MSYDQDPKYAQKPWTMFIMDGYGTDFIVANPLHVPRKGEAIMDFNYNPAPLVQTVVYDYKGKQIFVKCE